MAHLEGNGFFQFVRNVHQFLTMLITLKWLWGNKYGKTLQKLIIYIYAHCTYTHCTYRQIVLGGPRTVGSMAVFTQGYFLLPCKSQRQTPKRPIGPFQSMCLKPGRTEKELLASVVACFKFEFGN